MGQDGEVPKSASTSSSRTGTTMEIPAYTPHGETPGEYPYTRGISAKPDLARLFAARASAGVGVTTLRDLEARAATPEGGDADPTFDGSPIVLLALHVALADVRGTARSAISGTVHAPIVAPRSDLRLVTDMVELCTKELPRCTVAVSYSVRESDAKSAQEIGVTLATGIALVESCLERGLAVDDFAPRLAFRFDVQDDFLEEIAKLRAARRLWAKIVKTRFGATNPEAMKLRTLARTTAGTDEVRESLQALAAILGGAQSLETSSLRVRQTLMGESSVARVTDPFGGAFVLDELTNRLETEATAVVDRIDDLGGLASAVEKAVSSAPRSARAPLPTIDEDAMRTQSSNLGAPPPASDPGQVKAALDVLRTATLTPGANIFSAIVEAAKAYATVQEISDVLGTS